jgi:transposase
MAYETNESSSQSQHQTADGSSTKNLKLKKPLRLSHNEMLQVWHLYTQTDTKVEEISKMFNISAPVVYDYLDRVGLPYKRRGKAAKQLTSKQSQWIKSMSRIGHSSGYIAKQIGCHKSTVYRHLSGYVPAARNKRSTQPVAALQTPPKIEPPIQMIEPKRGLFHRIMRFFF